MNLKKSYAFLYVPDDHSGVREFRVPRWAIGLSVGVVAVLGLLAAAYIVGLPAGASWRPGGSRLARENALLREDFAALTDQVESLRGDLNDVYGLHRALALAVDLQPIDPETYAAGVGGRGPLAQPAAVRELGGLASSVTFERSDRLESEIGQLVRQARIQRQGLEALIDSLDRRSEVRAAVPSIRPCDSGWLSSRFGRRKDPFTGKQVFHRGVDFSLPIGTPVRATGDGIVVAVQRQRGLGKVVKVEHGNGIQTVYAHLNKALVEKGARIRRGEVIAESGNTGRSTAPHLHYEVRVDGCAVNPLAYILDSYASRN
jgi:murein DD-endopeptidase MepM/ murein hydrolase activator NlpD